LWITETLPCPTPRGAEELPAAVGSRELHLLDFEIVESATLLTDSCIDSFTG
jgi:hypothetical protein